MAWGNTEIRLEPASGSERGTASSGMPRRSSTAQPPPADPTRHQPIDLSFAIWLSRQLRRQRLTQRELARRSGLNHSTISRILLGLREPSWGTVQRLALVVGYPPPNVLLGRFGVHSRAEPDVGAPHPR